MEVLNSVKNIRFKDKSSLRNLALYFFSHSFRVFNGTDICCQQRMQGRVLKSDKEKLYFLEMRAQFSTSKICAISYEIEKVPDSPLMRQYRLKKVII